MSRALTPRQRHVRRLADQGLTNKQIASKLGIALKTVKNHIYDGNSKTHTPVRDRRKRVVIVKPDRHTPGWWDAYHWHRS